MLCKIFVKNPADKRIFVFFNGFGSDYKFWDDLLPYFADYNHVLLSENYFEYPEDYKADYLKTIFEEKELIGIGHSLGYHKLCALNAKYDFFKLQKIVAVQGFSCYLGHNEITKHIRKFYLDFMKISYTYFPQSTLYNFMYMCGAPMPTIPAQLNHKLLMSDLELLYSGIKSPKIPHLVLSSYDDWVIPINIIEDNFRKLEDVKIIYTMGTGHLLGMKYPHYVSEKIQKFAN